MCPLSAVPAESEPPRSSGARFLDAAVNGPALAKAVRGGDRRLRGRAARVTAWPRSDWRHLVSRSCSGESRSSENKCLDKSSPSSLIPNRVTKEQVLCSQWWRMRDWKKIHLWIQTEKNVPVQFSLKSKSFSALLKISHKFFFFFHLLMLELFAT